MLAAALVLLASLITVAVLHFHLLGGGDTPTLAGQSGAKPAATKTKPATASPGSSGKTPPAPGTKGPSVTGSVSKSPTPSPSTKPTPTPQPPSSAPPAPPAAAAPRYPLLVLNNSSVSGLGSAAAADFETGGWTIAGVGNLAGRLKDTTVYFDPGYEPSALALAKQFPQLHRVLARIPGLPGDAKLTVVVTRYYEPGGGK